jgi:hypothetical protein
VHFRFNASEILFTLSPISMSAKAGGRVIPSAANASLTCVPTSLTLISDKSTALDSTRYTFCYWSSLSINFFNSIETLTRLNCTNDKHQLNEQ